MGKELLRDSIFVHSQADSPSYILISGAKYTATQIHGKPPVVSGSYAACFPLFKESTGALGKVGTAGGSAKGFGMFDSTVT